MTIAPFLVKICIYACIQPPPPPLTHPMNNVQNTFFDEANIQKYNQRKKCLQIATIYLVSTLFCRIQYKIGAISPTSRAYSGSRDGLWEAEVRVHCGRSKIGDKSSRSGRLTRHKGRQMAAITSSMELIGTWILLEKKK